jgi:uncharacterized protein YndB with AHSA1/START domain
VPEIHASIEINESPESIWRVLMALEAWPEWSPLFQMVRLHEPSVGIAGGFSAQGLIGRIPYNAEFMVPDYEPLQRFIFETVNVSTPYSVLWHDIQLSGRVLTWTVVYSLSGGPGGILVDRLLIRRQAQDLVDRTLEALLHEVNHPRT